MPGKRSHVAPSGIITCTLPEGQGSKNDLVVSHLGQNSSAFSFAYPAPTFSASPTVPALQFENPTAAPVPSTEGGAACADMTVPVM